MRRLTLLTMAALLAGLVAACPDNSYKDPPTGVDADLSDGDIQEDAITIVDVADMPDRAIDPEGPDITIIEPQPGQVLSTNQVLVVAHITDVDGVDNSSVHVVIPGGNTFSLGRSGSVENQYEGIVDLTDIPSADSVFLFVQAADLQENMNSAEVEVVRDKGPTVDFLSPVEGSRHKGAVNLMFRVNDANGVLESSVRAEVGSVTLDIVKQLEDTGHGSTPHFIVFTGEIVFDDNAFNPALRSLQQITVSAENITHGVVAESSVTFVVDEDGPVITVLSPLPGEIVGGIITIEAEITDEAGVLSSSVVAVVGNDNAHIVQLNNIGGTFSASFDTTQFNPAFVFPTISVRASDLLSNESEVGFVIALDNTPPIVSLDPPENMRHAQFIDNGKWCSREFDPVGSGSPDDASTVSQVHFMRARIEDQGNFGMGSVQTPLSLVDYATPRVYWLTDTSQALVVDTDEDGYCDSINSNLIPTTNPAVADEILALYLTPIPPSGSPIYMPDAFPLPDECAGWGPPALPPELCVATRPEMMTVATFYTTDDSEPAIWTLPQVDDTSALYCAGHQFDNMASNIPEGWVCVAATAVDNAGNLGVSKPLRLCVDYTRDGNPTTCGIPGDMPECTGTMDPQTQIVDTSNPCEFDSDKQEFSDAQILVLP